jgi:hypothetical protein
LRGWCGVAVALVENPEHVGTVCVTATADCRKRSTERSLAAQSVFTNSASGEPRRSAVILAAFAHDLLHLAHFAQPVDVRLSRAEGTLSERGVG